MLGLSILNDGIGHQSLEVLYANQVCMYIQACYIMKPYCILASLWCPDNFYPLL